MAAYYCSQLWSALQGWVRYLVRPAADDLEPLADSSEDVNKYGSHNRTEAALEREPQMPALEGKGGRNSEVEMVVGGGGHCDLDRKSPARTLEGTPPFAPVDDAAAAATSRRSVGGERDDAAELRRRSPMFTANTGDANVFQRHAPNEEAQQRLMEKDSCLGDAIGHTATTADRALHSVPVERMRAETGFPHYFADSPSAELPEEEPPTQKRGPPGGFRLPALGPSLPGVQMFRKKSQDGEHGEVSPKPQTKELFKSKSSLGLPLPGARRQLPVPASDDADKQGYASIAPVRCVHSDPA
ncbi:unnamed protein product [Lampetra planeri]